MNHLIKQWRLEAGMTQEELAEKLYITPQAISLMENKKRNVQYELLQEAAKIFKKEIIFFVQDEPTLLELTPQIVEKELMPLFMKPGLINYEDDELEQLLSYEGKGYFAKSNGIVLEEAIKGALQYFENGLEKIKVESLEKAKKIMVFLEGGSMLHFDDLDRLSEVVYRYVGDTKDKDIVMGCTVDDERKRGFDIRIAATGF